MQYILKLSTLYMAVQKLYFYAYRRFYSINHLLKKEEIAALIMLNGWRWCRLPWSLITVSIIWTLNTCRDSPDPFVSKIRKATKTISFWVKWVWRYQSGNQNSHIEEQTTKWPKEKIQKDKQRSTIHTGKTKGRVTRTPPKTGDELRCSGRVAVPAPLVAPVVLL